MDNHWFKQLKKYAGMEGAMFDSGGKGVGEESANPGPVDNKPLFKEDGLDIRDHMIDELDYVLVPEEAWGLLVERFGVSDAQEPIKRKVVEHGMFVKHCKVEVYYIEFQLAENSNLEETKKKKFSKSDTLGIPIKEEMVKYINLFLFRTNSKCDARGVQHCHGG